MGALLALIIILVIIAVESGAIFATFTTLRILQPSHLLWHLLYPLIALIEGLLRNHCVVLCILRIDVGGTSRHLR